MLGGDLNLSHPGQEDLVCCIAIVVHPSFINSRAVACAMYTHLTGDHLPSDICKGKDNALVVAEMALATQDFDIIQDLRDLN